MPLHPGEKLGGYEILSQIGAGGMGEVYRARDTKLKREVAVKVLPENVAADPARLARFTREAEVLASLNHPNIATIFGVEDRALVMELVEGKSPVGPMDFDAAWKIAAQIADALEYAHDRGIVHRDLKPANILVNQQGLVKLLDFGLAKAFTGEMAAAAGKQENSPTLTLSLGMTQSGVILGTAAYMSPEQAKGKAVDQRADIWAFGVVLYELLTGERLFQRDDVTDTLAQVLTREPDLSKVPMRVRRLLRRCLEKDPKKRLRDIREAKHYLDDEPVAPKARMTWLPWAAALMALALGAAGYWRRAVPTAQRIHSVMLPPERAAFQYLSDDAGPAVLSPDGTKMAFVAQMQGKNQLWVRPLESSAAQALGGTESATFPFWSADGRWLGFFANGKLKKVEATGGTVTVLADAANARGGTWSRDDVILFGKTFTSPLFRVAAAGGPITQVTRLDAQRKEISHRWPYFLPDGKHFLFTSRDKGIFVASLDGGEAPRRLVEESMNAVYSEGHLLYARGDMVLARPFDARRMEFTGPVATVAQNVASESESDRACFSAANGILAYHSGLALTTMAILDHGARVATVGEPGVLDGLEISPDGKRVATISADGSELKTVWLYGLERATRTRVYSGAGVVGLVWSKDGKRLVLGVLRDGGHAVISVDPEGTAAEEVLWRSSFQMTPAAWLADRGLVLAVRDNPESGWDVALLRSRAQGGERVLEDLLRGKGDQLPQSVSPDGQWLVYTSGDGSGSRGEVFASRFAAITDRRQISTGGADFVRWRRDGKGLLYADRTRLISVPVRELSSALEVGEARTFLELRVDCATIQWSCFDEFPDGKRFLVMEPTGAPQPIELMQNWTAGLKK